jgi:3-deoxy-manno-octulosonate cytidylyltransferase (CMP-KDO synthetase)
MYEGHPTKTICAGAQALFVLTHPLNSPMAVVGMIPARLGSTRFPEKVLADATGKPLVQHVWENARRASSLSRLVIATDHPRVRDAATAFGAHVVMTREDHPNGSSRLSEAASALGLADSDVVVNIQGDEPEMEAAIIDAAVQECLSSGLEVATIASPFGPGEDPANPNIVKVVVGTRGQALYFSRSLIPYPRTPAAAQPLRHVGLYAYRVSFLRTYPTLSPTPLEQAESLEQLRVLEHGYRIAVAIRPCSSPGIDTPEQYAAFVARTRR